MTSQQEALDTVIAAAQAWARIWRDIDSVVSADRIKELDDAVDVLRYDPRERATVAVLADLGARYAAAVRLIDPAVLRVTDKALVMRIAAGGGPMYEGDHDAIYCPLCDCNRSGCADEPNGVTEACRDGGCPCHREDEEIVGGCQLDGWLGGEGIVECGKPAVTTFRDAISGRTFRVCAEHDAKLGPKVAP